MLLFNCTVAKGCIMQKENMDNLNSAPALFLVSIGGYMGASFSIENSGNTLLYKCYDYGYELKTTEEIVPTLQEWRSFRCALDEIGIWEWEAEYSDPGILDGTSWKVEIGWGNKAISSRGRNDYPGGDYDSSEFKAFIRAVQRLIGGRKFS